MKTKLLLLLAVLFLPCTINAYEITWQVKIDEINYSVSGWRSLDGTEYPYSAKVIADNYSGNLVIPDSIVVSYKSGPIDVGLAYKTKKIPVNSISPTAFEGCADFLHKESCFFYDIVLHFVKKCLTSQANCD